MNSGKHTPVIIVGSRSRHQAHLAGPARGLRVDGTGDDTEGLGVSAQCNYNNYAMKTRELSVTRIGDSRGVRLPAETLRRYKIVDKVILEERPPATKSETL